MVENKKRKGYPFRALLTYQLTGISEPEGQDRLRSCGMNAINESGP
jgi:hypothetical protein